MKKKKLVLIHTLPWYESAITTPFVDPWLKENPGIEVFNIMDDSLLAESLDHGSATPNVLRRLQLYFMAAEAMGADAAMCTCTSVAQASIAAQSLTMPVFNIGEPAAKQAVQQGSRVGLVGTVPTSHLAMRQLLEHEAKQINKSIEVVAECADAALPHRMRGDLDRHDACVHEAMDRLAGKVDVVVLCQISLAHIDHPANIPVLKIGHSGFEEAAKLLR